MSLRTTQCIHSILIAIVLVEKTVAANDVCNILNIESIHSTNYKNKYVSYLNKTDPKLEGFCENKLQLERKENENSLFRTHTENLVRNLNRYPWQEDETECLSKILNMLDGLQNHTLWATWVWDANAPPTKLLLGSTYHYGNYDACLSPPWRDSHPELRTKYCMIDVHLKDMETRRIDNDPYIPMEDYVKSETNYKIKFNGFAWGLCVPIVCEPKSVGKFASSLLENSHYDFIAPEANVKIDFCKNSTDYEPISYSFISYSLFSLFCVFAICASSVYLKVRTKSKEHFGVQILNSVSLTENMALLLKTSSKEIHVLHGIRFLTIVLEVFFHVWFISDWIGYSDALYFEKVVQNTSFLHHLDIVVDTFFVMAGLLFMKNLLESSNVNLLKVIFKRYVRCIYLMVMVLLSIPHLLNYLSTGPMKYTIGKLESDRCVKYLWMNIFTLQNYADTDKVCCIITWSLAVDFHMILVGALLFWIYRKNKATGVIVYLVLAAMSVILSAISIYTTNNRGVPNFDLMSHRNYTSQFFPPEYIQTHLRMSSFLIGFAFAYIFAMYKPSLHRNVISQKQSIVGFLAVMVIFLSVMLIGGFHYDRKHSAFDSAVFGALNRPLWAFAVALLISICEYGYIPYVSDFLGAKFFVPLSKLSFGVYLNNVPIFVLIKILNAKTSIQGNFFILIFDTIGSTVCCTAVSLVTWLIFEAPVNNLVALLLKSK